MIDKIVALLKKDHELLIRLRDFNEIEIALRNNKRSTYASQVVRLDRLQKLKTDEHRKQFSKDLIKELRNRTDNYKTQKDHA